MAKAPEYMVFDEWWNPELSDHMPAVIGREAAAGRLRAYTSDGADGKTWLVDDFVYSAGGPSSNKTAGGRAAERRAPPNPPDGEEVLVPASRPPLADAGGDQAIHDEDQYRGSPGLERRWYDDALRLLTEPEPNPNPDSNPKLNPNQVRRRTTAHVAARRALGRRRFRRAAYTAMGPRPKAALRLPYDGL